MFLEAPSATRIAEEMTEAERGEPDAWTYRAVHSPTGGRWSFIQAYDENGEEAGTL